MVKKRTKSAETTYHRENLRGQIVSEAERLLSVGGVEALSLREIARTLGVSHAAPSRHFASKEALLCEIALLGFQELAKRQAQTADESPAPADALVASGVRYIEFAFDHPVRFRVMFGEGTAQSERTPAVEAAANHSYGLLTKAVALAFKLGEKKHAQTLHAQTIAAWSVVHGYAMLASGGMLPVARNSRGAYLSLAQKILETFTKQR